MRRGAAWVFAGRAGDQVLTFVFGVVLARMLAPEDFGLLLTIQVFTGLAGFVAGGGIGQALIRAKTVTPHDYDVIFTMQLLVGLAIYALFYATAPLFARWYQAPIYVDLLRLSALSFVLRPLVNTPTSFLHREMRFRTASAVSITCLIVSSVVSITMAWHGQGVWSLVWGGLAGSVVQSGLLMSTTGWRPGLALDMGRAKDLARYGALVSGTDLVDYLKNRLNILILSNSLGPQSIGLFNKGESLARMPFTFVSGSVYQVMFRAMAAEQDNLDRCRYLFHRAITLIAVYGTPFYVGLLFLAEPLVRGVYGPRWIESAGPLLILVLAWPVWILTNMSGAVAAALNRLGSELKIQIVGLGVTAAAISLAVRWGLAGVAWATVACSVFSCVLMLGLALRTLQSRLTDALLALKPALGLNLALAATLAAVEAVLPPAVLRHDLLHVVVTGTAGGLVYACGLLMVPIAALEDERRRWRRLIRLPVAAR